ncbi:uncharacterized protein L201_006612 [Kwoniella dendrophila CBS 6074]|uniref:DUF6534 domain-containing protein n=1 Tax=Kwoniella dendrophila CBS 6074 TaxID=1295534 RepID=A0AAX4K1R2_9TREE
MASVISTGGLSVEDFAKLSINMNRNVNLGTYFIATTTDLLLCGVMIVQFVEYWTYSRTDRKFNKAVVIVSSLTSMGGTFFVLNMMFKLFVYQFGEYSPFATTRDLGYLAIFDVISSFATSLFFAERAFLILGRSKIFAIYAIICFLVNITGGIGYPVLQDISTRTHKESDLQHKVWMTTMYVSGALGLDFMVNVIVTWSMLKSKAESGWKGVDGALVRFGRIVIEAGYPQTMITICWFVTFFGYTDLYIAIYPLWVQNKFYTCVLLASLNSRYSLRRARNQGLTNYLDPSKPPVVHVVTETYVQQSEGSNLPTQSTPNLPKPRYSNPDHHNSASFSPRRKTQSTKKGNLQIEFEEESTDYDETPTLTNSINGNNNQNDLTDKEEDSDSLHKLDYIDNSSRTGLTDDSFLPSIKK